MDSTSKCKYLAVKIKDFDHWVWFLTKDISEKGDRVIGQNGWGKRGAFTQISVPKSDIVGQIESEELQYL